MKTITYVATAMKDGQIERKYSSPDRGTAGNVYAVLVDEGCYDSVSLAEVIVETTTTVNDLKEWKKS